MLHRQFTRILLVFALFLCLQDYANAQLTQPFLMKEGLQSVKKAAADSGWKSPILTTVVTIGDTTGIGGGLLTTAFDMKTGRSPIWIYILGIEDARGNSETKLLAYVKLPFLGLQQFPLPADAVPGDIPFQPQDSIPTALVMNSDGIVNKVNANATYQSFIKENPKAKSAFIVLFTSPLDIPGTPFTTGAPLWNFNFSDQADSLAPSLTCFVHGVTGETICIDAPFTSINEESDQIAHASLKIHPIPQGTNGILQFSNMDADQSVFVDVTDLMGRSVYSSQSNDKSFITLPLLPAGVYIARIQDASGISSLRFIQQ
ncbi:MAG: T9SS type A sorting domain-containing protein [Ignavibacteria bacterium]|nr:T9SS type A sorting domain-containing protein [Ignavibacteria bacterium]